MEVGRARFWARFCGSPGQVLIPSIENILGKKGTRPPIGPASGPMHTGSHAATRIDAVGKRPLAFPRAKFRTGLFERE